MDIIERLFQRYQFGLELIFTPIICIFYMNYLISPTTSCSVNAAVRNTLFGPTIYVGENIRNGGFPSKLMNLLGSHLRCPWHF